MSYVIPANTRIGHIHLKVSDLDKALAFYHDLLGFQIMQWYGKSAVFISAGGYHHHIRLNTWHRKNAAPAPVNACGLYHTAILYPERKDLVIILKRLTEANYRQFLYLPNDIRHNNCFKKKKPSFKRMALAM